MTVQMTSNYYLTFLLIESSIALAYQYICYRKYLKEKQAAVPVEWESLCGEC